MLHLQKFARWYSVLHELKFKLLTVFLQCKWWTMFYFQELCGNVHLLVWTFLFIMKLYHSTTLPLSSIFSWLYYLLLQIPPIKITVVYAKYFQILKSNWVLNIQTYGTTKPNTNFSISQWYHETLKSLKTSTIYCTPN